MCSALYCVTFQRHPFVPVLRPVRYEDAPLMRITQSISLSNIQTFVKKARPQAVGNLPGHLYERDLWPVSKSQPHAAAIRKQ
jgi:hypothetical protein